MTSEYTLGIVSALISDIKAKSSNLSKVCLNEPTNPRRLNATNVMVGATGKLHLEGGAY